VDVKQEDIQKLAIKDAEVEVEEEVQDV